MSLKHHCADSTRGIRDEGMPAYRRPDVKGNLYIKFEIEFPENGFLPHDKLEVGATTCMEGGGGGLVIL